jgi:hypothetical protein|tara:strand:+ start:110 stop:313 length:204 start_codon:yes stop_codon:yes gene_type:complete
MSLEAKFGNLTVEQVLAQQGGRVREQISRSVYGNTMREIEELANQGDSDARTAKKILGRLEDYKNKY